MAKAVVAGAAVVGLAYVTYSLVKRKGGPVRPLLVCGPSGVGKGTLLEMMMKEYPGRFGKCVSHTTRKPRAGEVNGTHYNFTSKEQIQKDIADGKFIEYAEVHGNYYGTSIAAAEAVGAAGLICILEIDTQGAAQVNKTSLNPFYYFFYPPNHASLEARLRGRGSESEETIALRLKNAFTELEWMDKASFCDVKLYVTLTPLTLFKARSETERAANIALIVSFHL
jgi:guanylate kinase